MLGMERYKIERELGRGAMGVVHLAHDEQDDREVALKELVIADSITPEKAEEHTERFTREAAVAKDLDNPNIVSVLDSFADDGRQFIVMEYLDGETLDEVLKRGPLPPDAAVGVTTQILNALSAAHEAGIVHRDLKPENIFVMADGLVKVADFGIARVEEASNLTVAGQILGTIGYMSPEQVRAGSVDARSDLFAVGVILHEILIGSNPFHADQPTTTMYRISYDEPPELDLFIEGMPAFITPIIRKSTAKDPELRYQSAKEMLADLEGGVAPDITAILKATEDRAAVQAAASSVAPPVLATKKLLHLNKKALAVVGAVLVVALAAGGGVYAYNQKRAAEEAARKEAIIVEGKQMASMVARLKTMRVELGSSVKAVDSKAKSNAIALTAWDREWSRRQKRYRDRITAVDRHNELENERYANSETTVPSWNGWYWEYPTRYTYETKYLDYPDKPKKPAKVGANLSRENDQLAALENNLNTYRSQLASATPQSRFFGSVYQVLGTTAQALSDSVGNVRTTMTTVIGSESRGQAISSSKIAAINLGALDAPFQQLDQQVSTQLTMLRITLAEIVPSAEASGATTPTNTAETP